MDRSFDSYRPDENYPSQAEARDTLRAFAEPEAPISRGGGFLGFGRKKAPAEARTGAITKPGVYLDGGFERAAACVQKLWGNRLSQQGVAPPRDAKTALQEWAQARRLPLPSYREVDREGPAHAPVFVVDVAIKGHEPSRGRGGSKREAERLAASALLERLDRS